MFSFYPTTGDVSSRGLCAQINLYELDELHQKRRRHLHSRHQDHLSLPTNLEICTFAITSQLSSRRPPSPLHVPHRAEGCCGRWCSGTHMPHGSYIQDFFIEGDQEHILNSVIDFLLRATPTVWDILFPKS
jgi:hypothetical protein